MDKPQPRCAIEQGITVQVTRRVLTSYRPNDLLTFKSADPFMRRHSSNSDPEYPACYNIPNIPTHEKHSKSRRHKSQDNCDVSYARFTGTILVRYGKRSHSIAGVHTPYVRYDWEPYLNFLRRVHLLKSERSSEIWDSDLFSVLFVRQTARVLFVHCLS